MFLSNRAPLKGVISDISWEVDFEEIKNIHGVIDARQMNRMVNSEKVKSICSFVFFILFLLKCSWGI